MRPGEVSRVGCQGGALQVGQRASHSVDAGAARRCSKCAIGADEHGGRHEELCDVDVEGWLRRPQRGVGEPDDDRLTVVGDNDAGSIESAMRDFCSVHCGDLAPELDQCLVADLGGRRQLQRIGCGLSGDDACVAALAERSHDDFRHPHTRLRRHQSRQSLVLDLLEPSDRSAPTWVAVREQPPSAREPLRVLGVAPEDADADRAAVAVVTCIGRGAHLLPGHGSEVVELDADGQQGVANLGRRRDARRGAEYQSDDRAGAESEGHGAEDVRRQRRSQGEVADSGSHDEPGEKGADGPHELWADYGGDGDGDREPVFRESPPRPQVVVDRQPVRSDHAADEAARARQHRDGEQDVAEQCPPPPHDDHDEDDRREPQRAEHGRPAQVRRPSEHGDHRLSDGLVLVSSRVRNRCREACQHGHRGEEHPVDRAPVSTTFLVLGQHQRAVAKEPGVLVARSAAPRGRDRRLRPEHGHFATLATPSARLDFDVAPTFLRRPCGRRRAGAPAVELAKRTSEVTATAGLDRSSHLEVRRRRR